jgi:hypothetical protein
MYDGPANMDLPANSGGDPLVGAVALNWQPSLGMERGPQLGVELGLPLYRRVNGVQLPQRWQISVATRYFF